MEYMWAFVTLALTCVVYGAPAAPQLSGENDVSAHEKTFDILMPGVSPKLNDTYLCFPTNMTSVAQYITEFVPHADANIAHHMLLYGCAEPGNAEEVWSCGEMASTNVKQAGPVCKSGARIIYAWAMDAPKLQLPKDVAFKVGGDSGIKTLVLQVHYKDTRTFTGDKPGPRTDNSGITIHFTDQPLPKEAGVYLLGTGGIVAAHARTYMETACTYKSTPVLHPFAFRSHTHTHGEVVSGYVVRDGDWMEIGRVSPQKPQMFYPVTKHSYELTVQPGDTLAARCTMLNKDDKEVPIGNTQNDEMCNFYIMYWMDGDQTIDEVNCFSPGPPTWSWNAMLNVDMSRAPATASVLPGTNDVLKATGDEEVNGNEQQLLEELEEYLEESRLMEEYAELYKQMRQDNTNYGNAYSSNRYEQQQPSEYLREGAYMPEVEPETNRVNQRRPAYNDDYRV